MKKTKRLALFLSALLILSLFAACKDQQGNVTPTPTPTPTATPTSTAAPSGQPAPSPTLSAPSENFAYPDLDGMDKTPSDSGGVNYNSYNSDWVTMTVSVLAATPAELAEIDSGWGPELQARMGFAGSVTSSQTVDLPGLRRKGLQVELSLGADFYSRGLVIPSNGQIIALYCLAQVAHGGDAAKQELLNAYDQFVQNVTLA